MPSDHPKPDRCGASVVDKVGLEIHTGAMTAPDELNIQAVTSRDDDDRWVSTNEQISQVTIVREGERVSLDPEFRTVIDYLRNGFSVESIALDQDATTTVLIDDTDPLVTNATTDHQGYCLRYGMDNGRCYVHGGVTGGAPEGNVNAMTHGLRARRSNYYQALDEEDQGFVEAMVDSWLEDAPFDRENAAKVTEIYRIAIDQHRLWNATDEYVEDGMVTEQVIDTDEDGNAVYGEDENPVNLPYSRLDRDLFKKLKELGCLDDPDTQQAQAELSLARKLSGLTRE